jgi:hypothetical protein
MNLRHPKLLCLVLLLLSKAAKPTSTLTAASAPCLSHKTTHEKTLKKPNKTPRTEPKSTAQTTKPLTKQLFLRKKGGKITAKQIQACYCYSRSGY